MVQLRHWVNVKHTGSGRGARGGKHATTCLHDKAAMCQVACRLKQQHLHTCKSHALRAAQDL